VANNEYNNCRLRTLSGIADGAGVVMLLSFVEVVVVVLDSVVVVVGVVVVVVVLLLGLAINGV
jgi:hypothetical protein